MGRPSRRESRFRPRSRCIMWYAHYLLSHKASMYILFLKILLLSWTISKPLHTRSEFTLLMIKQRLQCQTLEALKCDWSKRTNWSNCLQLDIGWTWILLTLWPHNSCDNLLLHKASVVGKRGLFFTMFCLVCDNENKLLWDVYGSVMWFPNIELGPKHGRFSIGHPNML